MQKGEMHPLPILQKQREWCQRESWKAYLNISLPFSKTAAITAAKGRAVSQECPSEMQAAGFIFLTIKRHPHQPLVDDLI